DPQHALDLSRFALFVEGKPPRPPEDRFPPLVTLLVKGARLEARVRIQQWGLGVTVAPDHMLLEVYRQGGEVIVAQDWCRNEIPIQREGESFKPWDNTEEAVDRAASAGESHPVHAALSVEALVQAAVTLKAGL